MEETTVGAVVGIKEGGVVGLGVGPGLGSLGRKVGVVVGKGVGCEVGVVVGKGIGCEVGVVVGKGVGCEVGVAVG